MKKKKKVIAFIVYVDDMVVTRDDDKERLTLHKYMSSEYVMKDLGALKYFLRIKVSQNKSGIFLSQRKYTLDLLQENGMSACQPIAKPIE